MHNQYTAYRRVRNQSGYKYCKQGNVTGYADCQSELEDEISDKVEDYGIFVVAKPLIVSFLERFKTHLCLHNRMKGLKKQNEQLQKKIEDIKFVDRANVF